MSYGIIRIQKFKAQAVRGIEIHDSREKPSRTNPDIDRDRSGRNYDLVECSDFKGAIQERLDTRVSKRAVRKDAVVMVQCLVTSDNGFFKDMPAARQREFFEQSLAFIADRYGRENIISATVHMDEKTPHMHVNFVPMRGRKLTAKTIFDRNELRGLQTDFHASVGQAWALNRGESREEKVRHLDTAAYKLKARKDELEREEKNLHEQAKEAEQALQDIALPKTGLFNRKKHLQEHIELLQGALSNKLLIEKENIDLRAKIDDLTSNKALLEVKLSDEKEKNSKLYKDSEWVRKEYAAREDFLRANPEINDAFWTYRKAIDKQKAEEKKKNTTLDRPGYSWQDLVGDGPAPSRPKQPALDPAPEVSKELDVPAPAPEDQAQKKERQRVKDKFSRALRSTPGTMGQHTEQCKELMRKYDALEGTEAKKTFEAEQMKAIEGLQHHRGR